VRACESACEVALASCLKPHPTPASQVLGLHANSVVDVDIRGRGLSREQLPFVVAALGELPVMRLQMQGCASAGGPCTEWFAFCSYPHPPPHLPLWQPLTSRPPPFLIPLPHLTLPLLVSPRLISSPARAPRR
jgi:hypothetical protein